MDTVGARIREARKGAGLTQKKLADEVGVSEVWIGILERNEKPAGQVSLLAIARVCGVESQWLLTGAEPRESPSRRLSRTVNEPLGQEAAARVGNGALGAAMRAQAAEIAAELLTAVVKGENVDAARKTAVGFLDLFRSLPPHSETAAGIAVLEKALATVAERDSRPAAASTPTPVGKKPPRTRR